MECFITRDFYIFSFCNNFSFIVEYLGPYVRTHSHLLFTHHATRGAKHMFFGQSKSFLHSICAVMKKENMRMLLNKRDKRFVQSEERNFKSMKNGLPLTFVITTNMERKIIIT